MEGTALGSISVDSPDAGCDSHQPHLLPPVSPEAGDRLTGGGWQSPVLGNVLQASPN